MRKLFLSLIITLGVLAAPNLWAEGDLRTDANKNKVGKSLTTQGREKDLKLYLENIIGATYKISDDDTTATMSYSVAPKSNAGDVYFVEVNDFWKGNQTTGSNIFQTINKGVNKIELVDPNKKQTTNTGTFYPYQAKDANKFFFVVRREWYYTSYSNYPSNYPFNFRRWYDEWSYVDVTNGNTPGYDDLTECYSKLTDGAPFFSPHNCNNSLEINHYITLNDPDSDKPDKYSFTAYLYIPKYVNTTENSTTITEISGATLDKAYSISETRPSRNNWSKVSNLGNNYCYRDLDGTYVRLNTSKFKNLYYYTAGKATDYPSIDFYIADGSATTKSVTVSAGNVPYVFFYRIKLGEIDGTDDIKSTLTSPEKTPSETDMKCYYKVNLDWGTSFDRFASDLTNTKYDTMKEHFIIQRSFDKSDWETIGTKDVLGNNVALGTDKVFTDNTLPDFDETTKKIGYTVYYRIVSEVQKSDGTVMSTTNSNVITVNIPGTTPFKLTLEAGGTSKYTSGTMDVDNYNYNEGSNLFVNTLTAGRSLTSTGDPTLGTESVLNLVCTTFDAEGNKSEEVIAFASCATYGTSSLDALINAIGKVKDDVTTAAGEKYDAQYQLVLELGDGKRVESNIVKIVNSKVSNISVAVHRSGTPDKETCATTELFRNTVKFKPQMSDVPGAGYYVYCNGELVLTLDDNTNNTDFKGSNSTIYTVDKDGYITMTFFAEHAPIAVGETGETSETTTSFHYAVAHFDAAGNTYGSAAKASSYSGAKDELVVTIDNSTSTLGKHYDLVFIRPVLNWKHNKNADDVKSPIRYDIYMKIEKAEFEKVEPVNSSGRKGNVEDWEGDNFGKYFYRGTVYPSAGLTFSDEIYYARRKQNSGTWVNPIANDEIRPVSYYVKAVYSDDAVVKQNVKEKNSDVFAVKASAGGIFTAIDDVAAEGVSVVASNGVITVTGVSGTIVVYSTTGQTVATAQGDGGVTTIDASNLNGVYIVKANNMKPTKILIK